MRHFTRWHWFGNTATQKTVTKIKMKTLKTLVLLVVLTTGSQFVQANDKSCSCIEVLSTKRDIFYFKSSADFTGATIEVYSFGKLIFTDQVVHHKTLIDFYFEKPGVYTIKIIKGSKVEEFTFHKQSPSPYYESESDNHIQIG